MKEEEKRERLYARYMRMFAPLYDISVCRADEIEDVIDFIDTYWKRGHALVRSRALMDWQHCNPRTGTYNFVIARSKANGEIHALEGFIPTSQFDPQISAPMTWGAIWKTREDVAPPGLGVVVKQYREHEFPSAYAMEVGISADAARYNRKLGNTIFELEPWYIANPGIAEYKLFQPSSAASDEPPVLYSTQDGSTAGPMPLQALSLKADGWDALEGAFVPGAVPPFKSHAYYANRYFAHPIYHYEALQLVDPDTGTVEVLFYRVVSAEGRRGIFLVDYIGDGRLLCGARKILVNLLMQKEAEYMLFLCHGVPEEALLGAGFKDRRLDDAVAPVYYEPFLRRNVQIFCTTHGGMVPGPTFKGDADQDRPSVLDPA